MKKLIIVLLFTVLFLTSCITNTTYYTNKKILNEYKFNSNYAILTYSEYKTSKFNIDFKKIVDEKLLSDGKDVELFASTRYLQLLINDNLYFFYEYNRNLDDGIGYHALGYVDFNTFDVYVDYFDYARYMFNYNFSTKDFVCFTFKEDIFSDEVIDIVFFKDSNKLEFDYDLSKLEYSKNDIETPNVKDYYIENGVKYQFEDHNYNRILTNTNDNTIVDLPYGNDILDRVPLLKEMYDRFTYDEISINIEYISTGNELFFYIHDRPLNSLNVPYMIFKCNIDFTEVEYIGYCEDNLREIILL